MDLPPTASLLDTRDLLGRGSRACFAGARAVCWPCADTMLCCFLLQARRILCDYAAKQEAAMTAAAAEGEGEGGCVIS